MNCPTEDHLLEFLDETAFWGQNAIMTAHSFANWPPATVWKLPSIVRVRGPAGYGEVVRWQCEQSRQCIRCA